jgi:cell division protein ZapA (FtsZ GTPase activity inhibitor)
LLPLDYETFTKRICNMDDFSKLYGELKSLNRRIKDDITKDTELLTQMKKMVEDRLEELMYISLV